MNKLRDTYYQPNHLWKGKKAIKSLKGATDLKYKAIKTWLARQAFWQVHLPAPKYIERPHYEVTIPNQVHQFDLLYMPGDKLYGNKYKYILSGIDVASRYKVARPLRTKKASDVATMLSDIYRVGPLRYPKIFQCDNGGEFKSDVWKLMEKHGVRISRATTKYKHTHTAFVERLNKTLAEHLFKIQDAQELNDSQKVSSRWVKYLYGLVDQLNNTKTRMIDLKPKDAIKLSKVSLIKQENYASEGVLLEYGLYRYLLQHGEEHGDQGKRATDRVWSKQTYRISEIKHESNNRVIYYLEGGPKRSFVREELMLIPEDTEVPPDYVQNW